MLVTLTSTAPVASQLSHLLRKHPDRAQSFPLSVGLAHVFYPEVGDERCTVAMLLEVDPIDLARSKNLRGNATETLSRYVNDRPYASSSMVAVALGQVFRSAMTGRSETFPELAASALPLEITVAAVPARGPATAGLATRLFAPLGWEVTETPLPLDPVHPEWGASVYVDLVLRGTVRLSDALRHLYVLLPVLDDSKHYWVSDDEVGKLQRAGEGWLAGHPERDLITRRYLAHQKSMVDTALDRLASEARLDALDDLSTDAAAPPAEASPTTPLATSRADAVLRALRDVDARTVADVGCGEGALLVRLDADPVFTRIVGSDVSARALEKAARRLRLADASDRRRERISLVQSSVTYQDDRLAGLDAIVLMEVVEHLDIERLPALESSVFGAASPAAVVVTTPNSEYNRLYDTLPAGAFRHEDHRFEWTRAEFESWAQNVADRHGYAVEHRTVGDVDPAAGSPTQLALCRKVAPR
ncbi:MULTISPECIES: 3' terminal RNA ribose 2'-O-methyltransferase Hen1 [Microbacterium]|uniref:3' terminal RNA ribose 2'-O-methyltransferase Hen1 n=1 Tax=Microbacterium TaxID=33882 RepID=UPI00278A4B13|nr:MULTISPECIES: 3' terminal RNA ribose 2'-O-methyltransferase Hen1 [Microbacterium]MDQ1083440.1 3' terminal RNA ribose 2'-O-methyltransferase Hen1 [Microbacterium sp. SORGH_AS_0344]MDQ1171280.1 3' terminal RNA ribose 2'-O-methyltransferase Hen1 [Microbacterium proteolyticum]